MIIKHFKPIEPYRIMRDKPGHVSAVIIIQSKLYLFFPAYGKCSHKGIHLIYHH